MRKTILAVALLFAVHSHAAGAANFAGRWSLDKAQSKDLPPFYEQVKSHSLDITQEGSKLVVGVEITSDAHDPLRSRYDYTLDGVSSKTETQIRTQDGPKSVPTVLTANPAANGDLAITIERELPMPDGNTMKGKTNETWHLSEDGKTLTIARVDENRRGVMNSTLVFVRQ